MDCPKCNASMEPVYFEGVTVDRCTQCAGIWFDAGEYSTLRDTRGAAAIDSGNCHLGRRMDHIKHILCPRCRKPTTPRDVYNEQQIHVELCEGCNGVFLDAGEFKNPGQYAFADYFRTLIRQKPRHG